MGKKNGVIPEAEGGDPSMQYNLNHSPMLRRNELEEAA